MVDALDANRSIGMSRVYAFGSPYCGKARELRSDGRCAIISKTAEERHEARVSSLPIQNMRGHFISGTAAGLGEAVSFKARSCRTLWKPERAALMAVSED